MKEERSLHSSAYPYFSPSGSQTEGRHIQLFNSFHPDASEPQLAFCSAILLQGSDQSSAVQRLLINLPPTSLCLLSYYISMSFFHCPPLLRHHCWRVCGCQLLVIFEQIGKQQRREKERAGRRQQASRYLSVVDGATMLLSCCWYYYYYSDRATDERDREIENACSGRCLAAREREREKPSAQKMRCSAEDNHRRGS